MAYETHRGEETPDTVRATKARQGSWGRHIFWVLVISIVLAAIGLLGTWAISSPAFRGEGGQERAITGAQQFDAPEPAPKIPDASTQGAYPLRP